MLTRGVRVSILAPMLSFFRIGMGDRCFISLASLCVVHLLSVRRSAVAPRASVFRVVDRVEAFQVLQTVKT